MKKYLAFIFTVLMLVACGPAKTDLQKYDNKISSLFDSFLHVYTDYVLKGNSAKPATVEEYREYACNNILPFIAESKTIEPIDGNSEYAAALTNYFLTVQKTMQEQDGPKLKLLMLDSLMTKEDSLKVKQYTATTLQLTDKVYLEFLNAQKKFRAQYGLKPEGE